MTAMRNMGNRQGGFTLVEMMVAMLLGIMILLAVSEVFVNNNRTRVEIENTTRQIENGRYAMQLLEGELANAGFFGESSGEDFTSLPPACVSSSGEVRASLGVPVYGGATVGTECRGANVKAESAYLAIRRSSTCAVGSTGCDPFLADAYHLRVSACLSSTPGLITLERPASMEAMSAVWSRGCADGGVLAPTYRYLNHLYYVSGDDVLMRAELEANGDYEVVPLVDGIERLHFSYGLDDDDDGEVDKFLDAPAIEALGGDSWGDVVAIRVWLLARNLEPASDPNYKNTQEYDLGPGGVYSKAEVGADFDDRFKRQLYTSTVRLNNIAGRRESPETAGATGGEEETTAEESPTEEPSDPVI